MVNVTMVSDQTRPRLWKQATESLIANTPASLYTLSGFNDFDRIGVGRAKNEAVKLAEIERGKFLYISDDDVYFTPNWLPILLTNFKVAEGLGFKLLGAYNHPYHKPIGWEDNGVGEIYKGVFGRAIHSNYAVGSASWLMRWETWDEFGPFSEKPEINGGQDCEFGDRIRKAGWKIGHIEKPVVLNCGVTSTNGKDCPGADLVLKEIKENWVEGIRYE